MKYYRYLYVGRGISNIEKYKARLLLHKKLVGFYVITIADGQNQLDIMNAFNLKFKFYRKHPPIVVGIARDYDTSVDIVVKILNESIEHTGSCDIKSYLIKRAKTKDFTVDI